MTHPQIEDEEVIERYARNQLAPEARQAFEEHFFSCEECFEKVQATERFIAGIRDAARAGRLSSSAAGVPQATSWAAWMVPAFAASTCAAVLFAGIGAWMLFVRMPRIQRQVAQASAAQQAEREAESALKALLARDNQPEANLPLVMLQATRNAQAPPNEISLPLGARHLVLWVDMSSGRYSDFRLEVRAKDNRLVETIDHLHRNTYGALAASVPVQKLQAGEYRITLKAQEPPPGTLLGEYRLRIRKP
jgi:type II secretory pathway pseudopilin PulG